ncbi:MAG TPA: trigger factor [Cryptosporangiaceae bacterium]|nr:trigger factor [Cryptosporangiaceae bacterium]
MKSTVETLSPTRVRLAVEVPFEELKPNLERAYRTIAGQITIPGFRKGKVPPRLIDQRVGRAAVLEETLNEAIPAHYSDAVREHSVKVIGHPEVDVTELVDGEKVTFTAEVDVRPEIELPAFSDLVVTVDEIEVTDAEVDEQVGNLRERFAILKAVDRPVEEGDYVSLDLLATVDGEPVPGGVADGLSYEVGSGQLLMGTDEAVLGRSVGEESTFTTALVAGEFAGREAEVKITVRSVKEKILPPLDDDFAQTASEFDSLDELRADVRARLEKAKQLEQTVHARDKTLETLLAAVDVPMPEKVLEEEIAFRRQQLDQGLERAGVTLEDYLEREGQTPEEFDATLRTDSAAAVKAQLVLDTIADAEQLGVNDTELTGEVVRRAKQAGVPAQEYADRMVKAGQLAVVVADLRRGKALAMVIDQAQIRDTAGAEVNLDLLKTELAAGTA